MSMQDRDITYISPAARTNVSSGLLGRRVDNGHLERLAA